MKYYLHDSNSFNDDKITELYINFGYEGLGLFYSILEKFAAQENPIKTNVLKKQLNIGKKLEKCFTFLEQIGLIQSLNGESFNIRILNYAGKYKIKNQKNLERVSQWRNNQQDINNVTRYVSVSNACKVNRSKVNRSKVNKSIENKVFTPPHLNEVIDFFIEKGSNEEKAKQAYEYYQLADWHDSKGNRVKNWKQKMLAIWINNNNFSKTTNYAKSTTDQYKEHSANNLKWANEWDAAEGKQPFSYGKEE